MGGAFVNSDAMNGQDCDRSDLDGGRKREDSKHWRPLLLIIPLRLGLTEINPVYISSLKVSDGFNSRIQIDALLWLNVHVQLV